MKNLKRKFTAFLVLASVLTLLLGAVPASAQVDDAMKEEIKSSVELFLTQIYEMDDASLEVLKDYGGFYDVLYNTWTENKKETGAFKSFVSTEINDSDPEQLVTTSIVSFENYDAEVIVYFDAEGTTPVNYEMNIQYSLGEKFIQAAQNMVVGLLVVFFVLIFLTLVIYCFKYISVLENKMAKKEAPAAAPAPKAAPTAAAPVAAPAAAPAASDDTEIAAVIAAAIAAAMEDAPSESGYVVRSVRKVGTGRWKRV